MKEITNGFVFIENSYSPMVSIEKRTINNTPAKRNFEIKAVQEYRPTKNRKKVLNSRKRRHNTLKKIKLAVTAIAITIMIAVCLGLSFSSEAKANDSQYYKYFKGYTVEQGDSLWKLASEYAHNQSYNDYIKEVKSINNMFDNTLAAGSYIVIPYYSTEFIQ